MQIKTYSDWFTATCRKFQMSEDDVALILVNQSALIPDATADVNVSVAKKALCNEFASLIPMFNTTEGGYSISWNTEAIKLWYNLTCRETGVEATATKPIIRNKSFYW